MLAAELDIVSNCTVDVIEFFVLFFEVVDLLIALVHLAHSHSMGVLCLVEDFGKVVVPHNFSLGGFVVMQGL